MADSMWEAIDDYLVAAAVATMGTGSALTTHVLQQVTVAEKWDPAHWTLPAMLIEHQDATHEFAGHQYGTIHLRIVYPYILTAVCTVNAAHPMYADDNANAFADAKAGAQQLYERMREMLRARWALGGLTHTTGETVEKWVLTQGGTDVSGPNEGYYYGIAGLGLEVHTII